jgi:hypothetical protein
MRDSETIIGEACALAEKSGRAVYVFAGRHGLRRDFTRPVIHPYTECTAWGESIARPAGFVPETQTERELMYHARETPAAIVAPVPVGNTRAYDARLRGRVLFGAGQDKALAPVKLFGATPMARGPFGTRAQALSAPVQGPPQSPSSVADFIRVRRNNAVAMPSALAQSRDVAALDFAC